MRRLDENYEFFNVDVSQWLNLLSTLPELSSERGILYLLYQGSEITQAFHSLQGIRPDLTGPFSSTAIVIRQLQESESVDAVIMFEQGLAVYLLAKIQAAFTPEMDILQYLELAQDSIDEEFGRRFHVWPQEFWGKGMFSLFQRIRTLLDELPPDFLFVFAIFEENQIWTSLIIERVAGQIRRITTTRQLTPKSFEINEWQTDYVTLNQAVSQQINPPTLGFFTDDETLRFLLQSESPLDFIRQAHQRGLIIIDPIPSRIKSRL